MICITSALLFHGTSLIILHGLLHVCVWLEDKTGRGNDGILGSRKRKTNWEKEAVSFLLLNKISPCPLQSMGSHRVGHDWATSLSLFTLTHWRRQWQPTPVFLPGESQGRGSLVGCRLWGRTESDTTEVTQQQQQPLPCLFLLFDLFF